MIFTFYSYKGGVGRSMALANVAEWLYRQGLRVVVVDWDLEAPGLESFFFGPAEAVEHVRAQLGLVDVLASYKRMFANLDLREASDASAASPAAVRARLDKVVAIFERELPPLAHALFPVRTASSSQEGQPAALWLLPAGARSGERFKHYAETVQGFGWAEFYARFEGEAYFQWMREQLLDETLADVVLIDSRTGVTEMGGVCTRQMADVVVCLCAPNAQNMEGVASMAASFGREEIISRRGRELKIVMVPSRVDSFNTALKNLFESEFRSRLDGHTPAAYRMLKSEFWDLRIPYISDYAYAERLAIGDPSGDRDLEEAYKKLSAHLAILAPAGSRLRRRCRAEIDRIFAKTLPSVFISCLEENRPLANAVRARLEQSGIPVWSDPLEDLSAGSNWEQQAIGMLDQSKSMVLLVSPHALDSPWLRAEWRRARERGLCIYPVFESQASMPGLSSLPRWMRGAHLFYLESDWDALVRQLQSPCLAQRVPFMAPPPPPQYVQRPEELASIKQQLLRGEGKPVPAVSLWGPGGVGKSTLAKALCQDDEVIDFFSDGILWVSLGPSPDILGCINKLLAAFSGETPRIIEEEAALLQLERVLEGKHCLIVLEDADQPAHLRPFLRGGPRCARLITTRDLDVCSAANSVRISIGPFGTEQALQTLIGDFRAELRDIAGAVHLTRLLGNSPLAIELASQTLRKRVYQGESLEAAIASTAREFEQTGLAAIESSGAVDSNQSVSASIARTVAALSTDDQALLLRLAFFPENQPIALDALAGRLGLSASEAERLARRFAEVALLAFDPSNKTVTLHPLIRSYLVSQAPEQANAETFAEAALSAVGRDKEAAARRILTRLVRLQSAGEFGKDAPSPVAVKTFGAEVQPVIRRLAETRLIALSTDSHGEEIATLAFPSLLSDWSRLRAWIDEDRSKLVYLQQLRGLAASWEEANRPRKLLLDGSLLASAQATLKDSPDDLEGETRAYVDASTRFNRTRRRLRGAFAAAALVVAGGIGYYGFARHGAGDYPEAQPTMPLDSGQASLVALADARAAAGDDESAITQYTEAIRLKPDAADVYMKRGLSYLRLAKLPESVADFSSAIRLDPNDAAAYLNRGKAYLQQDALDQAAQDFASAAKLDSASADIQFNLGMAEEKRGSHSAAIAAFSRAIELDPNLADAYFHRADNFQKTGQTTRAVADYQKLQSLANADSITVQAAQARLQQLGQTPKRAEYAPTLVYLHLRDKQDMDVLRAMDAELKAHKFSVQGIEVTPGVSNGDVRYFYPRDREQASQVKIVAESALARQGINLRLELAYRDAKLFPQAKPGSIEVWIPPLARLKPSPSAPIAKQASPYS